MSFRQVKLNSRGSAWRTGVAALVLAVLAACGSDKEDDASNPASASVPRSVAPPASPVAEKDAARFLTQATFGTTETDLEELKADGYERWLFKQFNLPTKSHRDYINWRSANLQALQTNAEITQNHFRETYWMQALQGKDQLRQRTAFALAQIFVVSYNDPRLDSHVRGVASYYDMLNEHAFGNYRDLLEHVTRHPMMGLYLSSLRNQKEDPALGRVADENFAREVMQLFSIGLYELNNDGSYKGGRPVETYTSDDVKGLAKVFTGWSWYAGESEAGRTDARFFETGDINVLNQERDWRPMQAYAKFHSTSEKKFLGKTIPAGGAPDPEGDLKTALDTIFNHPNVGPFFGRLLIQRLVTSNPSPGYVGRVAAVFNDNGAGVRGDLKAVVRAVLLDVEARNPNAGSSTTFGKVREPVLRLSHLLRAFKVSSNSGMFTSLGDTDDPARSLSQTPMRSPSVFNHFRPNYVPPNSAAANASLVVPELQLANEVSVVGALNFMRNMLAVNAGRDLQIDLSAEMALADDPAKLVDRINLLLMSGQMKSDLRAKIIEAVGDRALPAPTSSNAAAVNAARRDRACIAILLATSSPDYLIQK